MSPLPACDAAVILAHGVSEAAVHAHVGCVAMVTMSSYPTVMQALIVTGDTWNVHAGGSPCRDTEKAASPTRIVPGAR